MSAWGRRSEDDSASAGIALAGRLTHDQLDPRRSRCRSDRGGSISGQHEASTDHLSQSGGADARDASPQIFSVPKPPAPLPYVDDSLRGFRANALHLFELCGGCAIDVDLEFERSMSRRERFFRSGAARCIMLASQEFMPGERRRGSQP